MEPPYRPKHADAVLMESTYGDRLHRPFAETMAELSSVFEVASANRGNILIPAFTVGRTQDLLYLMAEHFDEWGLGDWTIFLDSPMGIEATEAYAKYRHLYGAKLFGPESHLPDLPNFHMTRSTEESMVINQVKSGAIIIAGSGMMSGGRIHHHLKNNIWNPACHLVIVGYQAHGTLGRRIVDGDRQDQIVGRDLSGARRRAHDRRPLGTRRPADLTEWYGSFENRPPLYLVHGEPRAQDALFKHLKSELQAPVSIAEPGQIIKI